MLKKHKALWGVIIGLMVASAYAAFAYLSPQNALEIFYKFPNPAMYCLTFFLPIAICTFLSIHKKAKWLWLAVIPPILHFISILIFAGRDSLEWGSSFYSLIPKDVWILSVLLLVWGIACALASLLLLYLLRNKVKKLLAFTVVCLMMLELFMLTFPIASFRVMNIVRIPIFIFFLMYFLPAILTVALVLVKQYRVLWTVAVPSILSFVIWIFEISGLSNWGMPVLFNVFNVMIACATVLVTYICILVAWLIKRKNKGEDSSC